MGSYIEQNLANGERIIERAQVSWLSQFWYLLFGVLLVLAGISAPENSGTFSLVVGVVLLLIAVVNVITTELAITNRRVIAKFGLIKRNTLELKVNKVESIAVSQGIIGRIFNFGSIAVIGTGGSATPIPYIHNPVKFRNSVNQFIDDFDDGKSAI